MNEIITGLYIGSIRDSRDEEQLRANNITHILSVHDNAKKGTYNNMEYLCIKVSDKPQENLKQYFSQCNLFIHKARLQKGNVLIHCLAGVSRSATIVMAYLMSITKLNWKQAFECVRKARMITSPNRGFIKQLQEFERTGKLREERKRLCKIFRDENGLSADTRLISNQNEIKIH